MKTITIKLSEIDEQFNPRSVFSGMDELVNSIKSVGLLQPIVVRESAQAGRWVLVDGARRLRAMRILALSQTSAIEIEESGADEAQMAANLVRADLNILERARGYAELVRKFPTKYNAAAIAKAFGSKAKEVEKMISLARRLPVAIDKVVSEKIEQIGKDGLEVIAQVPAKHQLPFAVALVKNDGNVHWTTGKMFIQLSYMFDAVNSERLISEGKAFRLNRDIYTTDRKVYDEAKKAYEEKTKREYGLDNKEAKARTEKQKEADRKKRAERAAAVKAMPALLTKYLAEIPSQAEWMALGKNICAHHIYSESAKQLTAAFGLKPEHATRDGVWKQIFAQMATDPQRVVRLYTLLSGVNKYGQTSFAEQVAKAVKK